MMKKQFIIAVILIVALSLGLNSFVSYKFPQIEKERARIDSIVHKY